MSNKFITQDYIDGYIASLSNLIFIYRNELAQLRKSYYDGSFLMGEFIKLDYYDYRLVRKHILKNICTIKDIKKNYASLIKKINKLQKI